MVKRVVVEGGRVMPAGPQWRLAYARSVAGVALLLATAAECGSQQPVFIRGVSPAHRSLYPAKATARGGWTMGLRKQPTVFGCPDGSADALPFTAINDGFCHCGDGSDEPGTGACDSGDGGGSELSHYYCPNEGFKAVHVFPSRVNDGICDCCDGSDEWAHEGLCTNRCAAEAIEWNLEQDERAVVVRAGLEAKGAFIRQASKALGSLRNEVQKVHGLQKEATQALEDCRVRNVAPCDLKQHKVKQLEGSALQLRTHVRNFGKSFEWFTLSKRCVEYNRTKDGKYIYAVCPFDKVVQALPDRSSFTVLGRFDRWAVVSRAFPSCKRSILTEIYQCHACSCHEIEDGNAWTGGRGGGGVGWQLGWAAAQQPAHDHAVQERREVLQRPCPLGQGDGVVRRDGQRDMGDGAGALHVRHAPGDPCRMPGGAHSLDPPARSSLLTREAPLTILSTRRRW
jgi:hypothetical protein